MRAEHELRMLREPAVHADSAFVICRRADLVEIEPRQIAFRVADLALAEEQDIDDDVGASAGAEAAVRQSDRGDQVRRLGDMCACGGVRLVHRARTRDEGGQRPRLQQVDRPRDEVVMQAQTHGSIRTIRAHSPIGERRIADREVEVRWQFGACKIASDDARPWLQ